MAIAVSAPGALPVANAAPATSTATSGVVVPPGAAGEVIDAADRAFAPSATTLPPMPAPPVDPDPRYTGGVTWSVGPLVIHPGEKFTVRARNSVHGRFAIHNVDSYDQSPKCFQSSDDPSATAVCTKTAIALPYFRQPYWMQASLSMTVVPVQNCSPLNDGSWNSCGTSAVRWIAVVPPRQTVLSGRVTGKDGKGVAGVALTLRGTSGSWTVRTDAQGTYSALVPQATYVVTPAGAWDPPSRVVAAGPNGARADFEAAVAELDFAVEASHLVNGLDWTKAPATGLIWRNGRLHAHSRSGAPLANTVVEIDAPYFDGSAPGRTPAPRVSVCDATTYRPMLNGVDRVERITDANGDVPFTVMLGSEPSTSLWHARLKDDPTALDVERIGLTGTTTGPSAPDITTPMQNSGRLGLPAPPLFAMSAGSLQAGLIEWWLGYRAGEQVGPDRMLPAGDFVPVRTADSTKGAIVFYPSGNPGPLRDHLTTGAALPPNYPTATLGFRQVRFDPEGRLMQWQARLDTLPPLGAWEAENGPAKDGFLLTRSGLGTAGWLGGPIPPWIVDRTARVAYARCVPAASPPTTVVEVHSPVTVTMPAGSGGFAVTAKPGVPTTYVLPEGAGTLSLAGTGTGTATIVVRSDAGVSTYSFAARKGAHGSLVLNDAGAPLRLTYAGRTVAGSKGIALRLRGLPATARPGRTIGLRLQVSDAFAVPVAGATVRLRGAGTSSSGRTDARGLVRLTIRPRARGTVSVDVAAPAALPLRATMTVR